MRSVWMGKHRAAIASCGVGLAVALSACVSVLPDAGPPPQVHRFVGPDGPSDPAAWAAPAAGAPVVLIAQPLARPSIAGDRIAVRRAGGDIAAIADARWDGPATALYQEALLHAFTAEPQVFAAGEQIGMRASHELIVTIAGFEADLSVAADGRVARIDVRASLVRGRDRVLIARTRVQRTARLEGEGARDVVVALSAVAADSAGMLARWTAEALTAQAGDARAQRPEGR